MPKTEKNAGLIFRSAHGYKIGDIIEVKDRKLIKRLGGRFVKVTSVRNG